jgi:hypothetical protein
MMNLLELALWAQVGRPGIRPGGSSGPDAAGVLAGLGFMILCWLFVILLINIPVFAGMWKTFSKAGEPGWAAIVPFYNLMIMAKIAGKGEGHGLMIALFLCVPCLNIVGFVLFILLLIEFCKQYDVGGGFVVGLLLLAPIFWPIMGFGSTRYLGSRRRRRDYDDDEDDRPRKRRPRAEDEYEEEDDRPRRRRRDDDDEDEPRIRKPRRDDDDDEPRIRKPRRDDDY